MVRNRSSSKHQWERILLTKSATIRDVIELLNSTQLKTAYILDERRCVLGSVGDGDIRRSFLKDIKISSKAIDIANTCPIVGSVNEPSVLHRSKIQQYKLFSLPIVNEGGELESIVFNSTLITESQSSHPILIMAGGYGQRLGNLTRHTPKPMIKVGGIPILLHIIQNFSGFGFKNFFISIHFLGDKIRDFLKDGNEYGINIKYLEEKNPLGTAGCLQKLDNKVEDYLIVVNGDVFCDIDFNELIREHSLTKASATIVIRKFEVQNPYGTVEFEHNCLTSINEKPVYQSFINTGIYVISKDCIGEISEGENIDMPDFLKRLKANGKKINVFQTDGFWVDIGNPIDLQEIRNLIV